MGTDHGDAEHLAGRVIQPQVTGEVVSLPCPGGRPGLLDYILRLGRGEPLAPNPAGTFHDSADLVFGPGIVPHPRNQPPRQIVRGGRADVAGVKLNLAAAFNPPIKFLHLRTRTSFQSVPGSSGILILVGISKRSARLAAAR